MTDSVWLCILGSFLFLLAYSSAKLIITLLFCALLAKSWADCVEWYSDKLVKLS